MVNVTDGANVDVRFVTFKLFFSHFDRPRTKNSASDITIKTKADTFISAFIEWSS